MRAIQLRQLNGPDALDLSELPDPVGDKALVIEVHAAGVGFPDLLMTRGRYQFRPEPPFTPGVEIAGVVRTAPAGSGFTLGDRVAASSQLGAWAEVATASPLVTFRIPDGMTFEQATALVNYQTAYFALAERGSLRPGETVLVHGAAGGAGSAAIDVARALGAVTIAVARGREKLDAVAALGAEHCVEADGEWLVEVRRITSDGGVHIVFDPVGGDRFLDSVRALAPGGRLLIIGFAAGSIPELKVNRLLLRNTSAIGVAWAEYIRHDPAMPQRVAKQLDALWAAGKLHPLVGPVLPLERAADALRVIESRAAIGKVVLKIR